MTIMTLHLKLLFHFYDIIAFSLQPPTNNSILHAIQPF